MFPVPAVAWFHTLRTSTRDPVGCIHIANYRRIVPR